jgi:hypothetical protein
VHDGIVLMRRKSVGKELYFLNQGYLHGDLANLVYRSRSEFQNPVVNIIIEFKWKRNLGLKHSLNNSLDLVRITSKNLIGMRRQEFQESSCFQTGTIDGGKMANIEHVRGHDEAIKFLTNRKMIVSVRYRGGYLVARYGVNIRTLRAATRKMDGID